MRRALPTFIAAVMLVSAQSVWGAPVFGGGPVMAPDVVRLTAAAVAVVSPPLPRLDSDGTPTIAGGRSGLLELLTKLGQRSINVTAKVASGKVDFGRARVVLIDAGALSNDNGRIAKTLAANRESIAGFVESGGVLVVFTSPEDASLLDFLPDGLTVGIEKRTHHDRARTSPGHPILVARTKLNDQDLGSAPGVLYPGGCYGFYRGFASVVAADTRGRYPVILSGQSGKGRVLLVHLSPGRAFLLGRLEEKTGAVRLVDNILRYTDTVLVGKSAEVRPAERKISGVVFEDSNASGVQDLGEKGLAGLVVSDGSVQAKTDENGRYSITVDPYGDYLHAAADAATHHGPFWRKLPADGTVDIGLVRRSKPLSDRPRIVHLVDADPPGPDGKRSDAELDWMLEQISRLDPKPDMIVVTGNAGSDAVRSDAASKAFPAAEIVPVFRSEATGKALEVEHDEFVRMHGPAFRSFKLGRISVVVGPSKVLEARTPWLYRLGAVEPENDEPVMKFRSSRFLAGGFAGATASFRRCGWHVRHAGMPPGFRIIDWRVDGVPRSEFRIAGVNRLLTVLRPALESTVPSGMLNLSVAMGDTGLGGDLPIKISLVAAKQQDGRIVLEKIKLPGHRVVRHGQYTKTIEFEKPVVLEPGLHVMNLTVGQFGDAWRRNVSFLVSREAPIPRLSKTGWRVTGGNDNHTGESTDIVTPPLYLARVESLGCGAPGKSPLVLSDVVLVSGWGRSGGASVLLGGPLVRVIGGPFCRGKLGVYRLHERGILLEGTNGRPDSVRFAFNKSTPDSMTSHMLTGGEFLCVMDAKGFAWGFKRTGGRTAAGQASMPRWQVPIAPGCRQAVATDMELFTGNECLGVASGDVKWRLKKYRLRDCSVALSGKRVIVTGVTGDRGDSRQVLLVLERDTGEILWERELARVRSRDDVSTPAPAVSKKMVFVGSADGIMRALRLSSGEVTWQFQTGRSVIPHSTGQAGSSPRISSQAVISGDTVYFGAADGRFYAFDYFGEAHGNRRRAVLKWSYNVGLPITGSPAVSGNTIRVTDFDGNLHTFVSLVPEKAKP